MAEWMPIETAPKDGTEIVLWDGYRVGGGLWHNERPWDAEDPDGAWRWANDSCDCCWKNASRAPTHWMPLPKPPA